MASPSTDPVTPHDPRTASILRFVARLGVFSSAVFLPLAFGVLGPVAGFAPTMSVVGFVVILWWVRRGDLKAASNGLMGVCGFVVIYAHLTMGGYTGWAFIVLVILPTLAILLDRGSRAAGLRMFLLGVALLGLGLLVPDRWGFGAPSESTRHLMRLGNLVITVAASGVLATYAVWRLESAMTESLATEQRASRAAARKTAFVGNTSHELRTPMNAILGYSELLLEEAALTDEQRADVWRIRTVGSELLALVNEVLRIARLDATEAAARRWCCVS
ncbi:MAG: histidine kinase dimerization/phospho-acceptor domain-containing protein, partial [Myxococcota bacterium]